MKGKERIGNRRIVFTMQIGAKENKNWIKKLNEIRIEIENRNWLSDTNYAHNFNTWAMWSKESLYFNFNFLFFLSIFPFGIRITHATENYTMEAYKKGKHKGRLKHLWKNGYFSFLQTHYGWRRIVIGSTDWISPK